MRARRIGCAITAWAAILTLLVGCSGPSRFPLTGRVLDGRTSQPVTGALVALVKGVGVTRSRNTGRFTLPKVTKGTTIRVTADNYRPFLKRLVGSQRQLTVDLDPIPVEALVKSSVTSTGMKATIDGHGVTSDSGELKLFGLGPGSSVHVTAGGYSPADALVSPRRIVEVTLQAIPTKVVIKSNLSEAGIKAALEGHGETAPDGTLTLYAIPAGTSLHVSAPGYDPGDAAVGEDYTVNAMLNADPATTLTYLTSLEAQRNYERVWDLLVHPDAYAYIDKATYLRDLRTADSAGYSSVSVTIKGVTNVNWTFKCPSGLFREKSYPDAAAVENDFVRSIPGGGAETIHGVTHFVRTPDGRWRFFPTGGKCDVVF